MASYTSNREWVLAIVWRRSARRALIHVAGRRLTVAGRGGTAPGLAPPGHVFVSAAGKGSGVGALLARIANGCWWNGRRANPSPSTVAADSLVGAGDRGP